MKKKDGKVRYTHSLITQGKHRFYTLTMPSEVLAQSCFVSTRDSDPQMGFQRTLDKKRAQDIADFIDSGNTTIPTSIILSAQPEAELKEVGGGRSLEFKVTPKSFLILDGQHRVWGFSLAKSSLRVPVVIYNGLSKAEETRLFIDINTKQRPVPNTLLLDIKALAETETDEEKLLREVFDSFQNRNDSAFLGKMSPAAQVAGKHSRVTFNSALKPLIHIFQSRNAESIYEKLNAYFVAFQEGLKRLDCADAIFNPTVFRAAVALFPDVARQARDRHGVNLGTQQFSEVMEGMFSRLKRAKLLHPGNSYKDLLDDLKKALDSGFTL